MRVGIIAIKITDSEKVDRVNGVIGENSSIIIGRMGIPIREQGCRLISLIVEGDTDGIGKIAGSIGQLPGVTIKSVIMS